MSFLLFVGANMMGEIQMYVEKYKNGIFIEPISEIFDLLVKNLEIANQTFGTNYRAINALVTNEDGKDYDFNLFSNYGASSSIYEPNMENWEWSDVKPIGKRRLKSVRLETILDRLSKTPIFDNIKSFDLILDVQGAELEVLKSMGNYIKMVNNIKTEYSTKEFYKGGVLLSDLNEFLTRHGFVTMQSLQSTHADIEYTRATLN